MALFVSLPVAAAPLKRAICQQPFQWQQSGPSSQLVGLCPDKSIQSCLCVLLNPLCRLGLKSCPNLNLASFIVLVNTAFDTDSLWIAPCAIFLCNSYLIIDDHPNGNYRDHLTGQSSPPRCPRCSFTASVPAVVVLLQARSLNPWVAIIASALRPHTKVERSH